MRVWRVKSDMDMSMFQRLMPDADTRPPVITTKDITFPSGQAGLELIVCGEKIGTVIVVEGGFKVTGKRLPVRTPLEAALYIVKGNRNDAKRRLARAEGLLVALQGPAKSGRRAK